MWSHSAPLPLLTVDAVALVTHVVTRLGVCNAHSLTQLRCVKSRGACLPESTCVCALLTLDETVCQRVCGPGAMNVRLSGAGRKWEAPAAQNDFNHRQPPRACTCDDAWTTLSRTLFGWRRMAVTQLVSRPVSQTCTRDRPGRLPQRSAVSALQVQVHVPVRFVTSERAMSLEAVSEHHPLHSVCSRQSTLCTRLQASTRRSLGLESNVNEPRRTHMPEGSKLLIDYGTLVR